MCAAVYMLRHLVKATEVTAGLAESNGSLLPGLWCDSFHVTCGLTACTPGSAPGPTLGNEYGKTLPFIYTSCKNVAIAAIESHVGEVTQRISIVAFTHTQRCALLRCACKTQQCSAQQRTAYV